MLTNRFIGRDWKGIVVLIFCALLLVLCFACGKKEAAIPPPAAIPEATKATTDYISGRAQDGGSGIPSGEISATILPSTPSRLIPPRVQVVVKSGEVPVLQRVRWTVDGVIVSEGESLSPTLFKEGDKIAATVTVKAKEKTYSIETLQVTAVKTIPLITDVRVDPLVMRKGDTVRAIVKVENPDDNPINLRYTWFVDDAQVKGDSPERTLSDVRKGAWIHVMVVANNGRSDGGWKYSPKYKVGNALPVVRSEGAPILSEEKVLTCTIIASDPDGDALRMELVSAPPGMTLSGNRVTWNVPEDALGKPAEAVIRVSDLDGGFVTHTLNVTPRK
jgi:hypothetical protein